MCSERPTLPDSAEQRGQSDDERGLKTLIGRWVELDSQQGRNGVVARKQSQGGAALVEHKEEGDCNGK